MKLYDSGVFLLNGTTIVPEDEAGKELHVKKNSTKPERFPMIFCRRII